MPPISLKGGAHVLVNNSANRTRHPRLLFPHGASSPRYSRLMKNKQEGKHQRTFHKKLPFNVSGREREAREREKRSGGYKFDCFHTELVNYTFFPWQRRQTSAVNATVVFSHCKPSLAAFPPPPSARLLTGAKSSPAGDPLVSPAVDTISTKYLLTSWSTALTRQGSADVPSCLTHSDVRK